MSPQLQHPPTMRVLRTALQVLVAVGALVPIAVQALQLVGVDGIDGPALVAISGVAVMVATTVVNTIEEAGPIPIVRTLAQVLAALVLLVPAITTGLAQGGIHVDGVALGALAGLAVMAVTVVQNLLEQLGVIPELTKLPTRRRPGGS